MKKYIPVAALLLVAATFQSFKENRPGKPKLFPDIEKFYAGLKTVPAGNERLLALNNLYSTLTAGTLSDKPVHILFTCSDNSFRSLAAQVILQSLVSVNKYNKIVLSSCGYEAGEVSPLLLKVLQRHGFTVTEQTGSTSGKKSYEIKFGTDMPSLIMYAKQADDVALPKATDLQMKMCSIDETNCKDMESAKYKTTISYTNTKDIHSEDESDAIFTAIASDILWAFNKTKL
jgi:protein-tyrosine-phosphatase